MSAGLIRRCGCRDAADEDRVTRQQALSEVGVVDAHDPGGGARPVLRVQARDPHRPEADGGPPWLQAGHTEVHDPIRLPAVVSV